MKLLCKAGPYAGQVIDYPIHIGRRLLNMGVAEELGGEEGPRVERAVPPPPDVTPRPKRRKK